MIESLKHKFYKIIILLTIILMSYVTICSINKIYDSSEALNPFVLIVSTITLLLFFIRIKKKINNISSKKIKIIAIIITILFFIGMVLFGIRNTALPYYDLSHLTGEANIMVNNGGQIETKGYFGRFPHQIPVMILVYYIFLIGKILSIDNFIIIVNSALMALTAYFTFLTISKIKDEKIGLIALLFFVINPVFYINSSFYYTDTLSFPFAIIALYMYVSGVKAKNKKSIILYMFSGVFFAIGFKVRAVAGIFLIGIILNECLKSSKIKERSLTCIFLLLGFIIALLGYKIISHNFENVKNEEIQFPATHYLMMGLNSESKGRYSAEDNKFTQEAGNYDEKTKSNITEIKNRLKDFGFNGFVEFMIQKIEINWTNGDYEYLPNFKNVKDISSEYEYVFGNKKVFCIYFIQICKIAVCAMTLLAFIKEYKNNGENKNIYIGIFGYFVFYFLWEAKTRYTFSCLPWMILLFPKGLSITESILNINKLQVYGKENKSINMNAFWKNFCIGMTVFTVIVMVVGFDKYCIKRKEYADKVATQIGSYSIMKDITNKDIVQEFTVNKRFNSIALSFVKDDKKENNKYYLVLMDENDHELVKKEFDSDSIKSKDFKVFRFDEINQNGEQKYKIKLLAQYNDESHCKLGIKYYSDASKYDIYPDGKLFVNGESINGDLVFKIESIKTRTYISKVLYLIIWLMILTIQLYSFYPLIRKEKNCKNNLK